MKNIKCMFMSTLVQLSLKQTLVCIQYIITCFRIIGIYYSFSKLLCTNNLKLAYVNFIILCNSELKPQHRDTGPYIILA